MPDSEITYMLILNGSGVKALKTLIGSINDEEFANYGVRGEDRVMISEIYGLLPDIEEE